MRKNTQYWLFKSEPEVYSIDDLKKEKSAYWEGIRNYQARNLLRDTVKKGDLVFFYHSNASPPGIAGIAEVVKEGYPDHTQFDENEKYYDPKSKKTEPRWFMVDVKFIKKFKTLISLEQLKNNPALEEMMVTKRGARLSIQPVTKKEWDTILKISEKQLN